MYNTLKIAKLLLKIIMTFPSYFKPSKAFLKMSLLCGIPLSGKQERGLLINSFSNKKSVNTQSLLNFRKLAIKNYKNFTPGQPHTHQKRKFFSIFICTIYFE